MSAASWAYPTDRVTLREVGLRDGLQLVKRVPSTAGKIDWLQQEYAAGVRCFEVGSFLPASRMPQFADVRLMIDEVSRLDDARSSALTLNERGVDDALTTQVDEIVCVVSATEEHSQANMRRSRQAAVDLVGLAVEKAGASEHHPLVNAGIAMAFGCSIAGDVDQGEVLRLAEDCLEAGADVVGIADTVGFAGPRQVSDLCAGMVKLCRDQPFIVHLHDTRGLGLSNASAALDAGCRVLDASLGGLGGCPFAPGATGNIVFEDLVYLCETKGFATGIDIPALVGTRDVLKRELPDEKLYGALARSGPPPNVSWAA
ncbi:hydroxymethylglutaryl-CoA lyase [uncultured Tateyamaria sp.]|uniref:hydroxymethylglutaryl-CoA lyase n=1 Tax=uncultured Tateyamaria sp. TaxID=455651 RepID=UPI0026249C2A|nr:hydroxymethylglutaryl-CoA lyase [uncultured Tateyamaria sp.]